MRCLGLPRLKARCAKPLISVGTLLEIHHACTPVQQDIESDGMRWRVEEGGAGAMPAPERAIYFTLEKSASNCMVCPSCNVTITVVLALGSNDSYPNRAVKRDR